MITAYQEISSDTCGISTFTDFREVPRNQERGGNWYQPTDLKDMMTDGGCGWIGAGFIDTGVCKHAYEVLSKAHKLVYQTPVRLNVNSGNPFFYAVFDTHESVGKYGYDKISPDEYQSDEDF